MQYFSGIDASEWRILDILWFLNTDLFVLCCDAFAMSAIALRSRPSMALPLIREAVADWRAQLSSLLRFLAAAANLSTAPAVIAAAVASFGRHVVSLMVSRWLLPSPNPTTKGCFDGPKIYESPESLDILFLSSHPFTH